MKKISKSIILIISLVTLVGFAFEQILSSPQAGIVYAEGGIKVDWDGMPFNETNFLPGNIARKEVTVENVSGQKKQVAMKMSNTRGWVLAAPLFVKVIDRDTSEIYFGKWWGRSLLETYLLPWEIKLFDLKAGKKKNLIVEIRFLPESGNEFQGLKTQFDFSLGFIARRPSPLPPSWWPFPWPF